MTDKTLVNSLIAISAELEHIGAAVPDSIKALRRLPLEHYRDHLQSSIKAAGLSLVYPAVKTLSFYRDRLRAAVRDLYRGDITDIEYLTEMQALIDDQLQGAWNAGMREAGLDPQTDMTDAMLDALASIIQNEYDHLIDFAAAILKAKDDQTGFEGLYARADIWANRWTDTKQQALVMSAPSDLNLRWVYGDTDHCSTCEGLNDIIATSYAWSQSGVRPQNPPNSHLECGGWRCQCNLEPTDDKPSDGNIPGTAVPCNLRPPK